jgi:hypothetical protein
MSAVWSISGAKPTYGKADITSGEGSGVPDPELVCDLVIFSILAGQNRSAKKLV